MLREFGIAIVLTVVFSIGVGVLFVKTLMEMIELIFSGEKDEKDAARERQRSVS